MNRRACQIAKLAAFARDRRGAAALEFAIVSAPFILLLVALLQMSVFYLAQSALDAGVLNTVETLRNGFTTGATATLPDATTLKTQVTANAGGMIVNNSTAAVEIRQLTTLSGGAVPIIDGTVDYGSTTSVLVLRAQATVLTFAPGFGALKVRSAAIVRRQGT